MKRMPKEGQIDPSKTFESQKELVIKTIIPTIKKLLDPEVYPVGENVLYQIIYRRHRSQRNTYRISKKTKKRGKKKQKGNIRTHGVQR